MLLCPAQGHVNIMLNLTELLAFSNFHHLSLLTPPFLSSSSAIPEHILASFSSFLYSVSIFLAAGTNGVTYALNHWSLFYFQPLILPLFFCEIRRISVVTVVNCCKPVNGWSSTISSWLFKAFRRPSSSLE